jgi:hypothetical protein
VLAEGGEDVADALENAGGLAPKLTAVLSSSRKCKMGMRSAQPGGEGLSSWYRSKDRPDSAAARGQDHNIDRSVSAYM